MPVTTIETAIYSRLTGFAALAALVVARVYPNTLPQGVTYPAIAYRRVAAPRESAMGSDTRLVHGRFQFDVYGEDYLSARLTANQVIAAMKRWRSASGVIVQDSFIETDIDLYEGDSKLDHIVIDVMIHFEE